MRAGRHYATFRMSGRAFVFAGITRPVRDPCEREFPQRASVRQCHAADLHSHPASRWKDSRVNCCGCAFDSGACFWSDGKTPGRNADMSWRGRETIPFASVLGLLLDLDAGTLAVYKDGRRLGVIKGGLSGEYCWMATIWKSCNVTIRRGALPPTDEGIDIH